MGSRYCCVFECSQKGPTDKFGNKITYHRVPSQEPLRKQWIQKIRRRDYLYNAVACIYVCSSHFNDEDFVPSIGNKRARLNNGVIPSKFKWEPYRDLLPQPETGNVTSVSENAAEIDENARSTEIQRNQPLTNEDASLSIEVPEKEKSEVEKQNARYKSIIVKLTQTLKTNRTTFEEEKAKNNNLINDLRIKLALQEEKNQVLTRNLENTKTLLDEERAKSKWQEAQFKRRIISFDSIKDSDEDICFYTGLPNYEKLMSLFEFLNPGLNGENIVWWRGKDTKVDSTSPAGRPRKLSVMDQFLVVLMRLRLGLFVKDLAFRFDVSESVISVTCISWINYMYLQLGQMDIWSTRKQIDESMPEIFREKYPKTRCIIDATEIKCEVSKSLVLQTATYSNYKSTNTWKGLIGINPRGYVTFVSALFTGNISDKCLTAKSGFYGMQFDPEDSILADKGFLIEDELRKLNVTLNIPPFLREKKQYTKEEIKDTQKIAKLRIHVERRINRVKRFHILDRPIPISLAPVINQLWTVVALMTNFQNPLVNFDSNDIDDDVEPPLEHFEEIVQCEDSDNESDLEEFCI